jgi:acyl carrier protein
MKASMHRSEIETEFAALLDRVAGTPPSSVGRDTHLDALGLGSLAKIDLAVAAEDRFGVAIPDEDLERLRGSRVSRCRFLVDFGLTYAARSFIGLLFSTN